MSTLTLHHGGCVGDSARVYSEQKTRNRLTILLHGTMDYVLHWSCSALVVAIQIYYYENEHDVSRAASLPALPAQG